MPEIDRDYITKRLRDDFSCIPVYLSAEVAERYYNGFSNSILWPLFHCKSLPEARVAFIEATVQIIREKCHSMIQIGWLIAKLISSSQRLSNVKYKLEILYGFKVKLILQSPIAVTNLCQHLTRLSSMSGPTIFARSTGP